MNDFYMAWVNNDDILKHSSSGGIFSVLAKYVLNNDGVVVGAYLNQSNMELSHIIIDDYKGIDKLRGSKYFQSNAYEIYEMVIEYIKKGRWVLFSGTACQVQALIALCDGIDMAKVITVDVLCHGVASKKIVSKYLDSKKKQFKDDVKELRFRTKKVPWFNGGGTSICLKLGDGSEKIIDRKVDTFFMGFNCDLFLRESCYKCKFVGLDRKADFTLADFWGIKKERVGEHQYNAGVGLVLVNSQKGRTIWNSREIQDYIFCEKVSPDEAIPHNSALSSNRILHPKHNYFFEHFETSDFDRLVYKCLRKEYTKNTIKKLIGEKNIKSIKKYIYIGRRFLHE